MTGLSRQEAAARLRTHGYNELPSSKPRSIFRIALDMCREPMLLLLFGCALIYLLLGDVQEAVVVAEFVVVVIGIDLYQQHKTERALDALRDLSSPRALVIRDDERMRIAGREVVPGDLLLLSEGDRVPADAVLVSQTNFMADESLLTGESVPVRKTAREGVGAMERAEDEMAGLGRLDGSQHRLAVAHFADQDAVGILANDDAEGVFEVRNVETDFALGDDASLAVESELDRVFDADDVEAAMLVDVFDHGGERRALARTGDAADEDQPFESLGNQLAVDFGEVELVEVEDLRLNAANRDVDVPLGAKDIDPVAVAGLARRGKVE